MTTPLLPQASWFRLAVPCTRLNGLPNRSARARLLDLPAHCTLPQLSMLDGKPSWADVRVAWNPEGLAFQVEASGSSIPLGTGERPEGVDGVQIWVDTRDTRDVNRATRFCHRFVARLFASGPKSALGVEVLQRPIARAVADAPLCRASVLEAKADRIRDGWRCELFVPAEALQGFDPETNRRLGFAYQVSEPDRDQFLGLGRDFPIGENPSLWATLELRD